MSTPHDILDEILTSNYPDAELICKPGNMFNKKPRLSKLIQQLIFSVRSYINILMKPGPIFIFREYDAFSCLYLLLPKRNIYFNVNHNLKTTLGKLITKLLSLRYGVIFIDASEDLKTRYPYLTCIRNGFSTAEETNWDGRNVLLVCGSRGEQKHFTDEEFLHFSNNLRDKGFIVTCVGKNHPEGAWLSDSDYDDMIAKSVCICTSTYIDRHAGTLWFLKRQAPVLLFKKTNIACEQVIGHRNSFAFEELHESMEFLLKSSTCANRIA